MKKLPTKEAVFNAAKLSLEDHQSQTGEHIRKYMVKDVVEFYCQRVDLSDADKKDVVAQLWEVLR